MKKIFIALLAVGLMIGYGSKVEFKAATEYLVSDDFKGVIGDRFEKKYVNQIPISATVTSKDGIVVYRYYYYPTGEIKQKNTYTRAGILNRKMHYNKDASVERKKLYDLRGKIYMMYLYNDGNLTTSYQYRADGTRLYRRDYYSYEGETKLYLKRFYSQAGNVTRIRQYVGRTVVSDITYNSEGRIKEMYSFATDPNDYDTKVVNSVPLVTYYSREGVNIKRQTGTLDKATCYTYKTGKTVKTPCFDNDYDDFDYTQFFITEYEKLIRP